MMRVRHIASGLAAVLLVAASIVGVGPVDASAEPQSSAKEEGGHVTIILAPYLTWADISASATPALYRLCAEGAVANVNARSRSRASGGSPLEQGAVMLSSGSWAITDAGVIPPFSASEALGDENVRTVYRRLSDANPKASEVLFLGMPRLARLNESVETVDAVPGALGEAVVSAGGATAALGNADIVDTDGVLRRSRRAGVVASDHFGRVTFGNVSQDLLVSDPAWPFGVRTDLSVFRGELKRVTDELARHGGPSLLVLDPGDLRRAQLASADDTEIAALGQRALAIETLDAVVASAAEALPDDGLLIVVSDTVAPVKGEPLGLGACIVWGSDWHGTMSSSSTQREGLITNLDLTATAIDFLGLERPVEVLGNPVRPDGSGASAEERVAALVRVDRTAVAIDSAKVSVINAYIGFATILFAILAVFLAMSQSLPKRPKDAIPFAGQALILLVISVPPASMLMFAVDAVPGSASAAVAWLIGLTTVLWAAALILWRVIGARKTLSIAYLVTAGLALIDQWFGAPLSFTSFFGYSPLMGARYYGLGNEAAGMLVAAALIGLGLSFDAWAISPRKAGWLVLGCGAAFVATAAAPTLGANVGVIAWGTVGVAVTWALVTGRKITPRTFALAFLAGAVMLVAFAAYDVVTAGQGVQTHLGRALGSAQAGGMGALWTIVLRKAETNMRVFTRTNWSYLLVVVLGLLGYMRWRPQGGFASALRSNPDFSAALAACLVAGVVAFFTEDSGIVIPAVMMVYVGAATLLVMLTRPSATGVVLDRGGSTGGGHGGE